MTLRDHVRALSSLPAAASLGSLPYVLFHLQSRGLHLVQERYGPLDRTLLHLAARGGSLDVVRYLRGEANANLFANDENGKVPIDVAKSKDVVEYLRREMNWEHRKPILYCFAHNIHVFKRLPPSLLRTLVSDCLY